jgi:hypothetical protein
MGYSHREIDDIQERWNLRFPPDLIDLLLLHRPLVHGPASFDWLLTDTAVIQDRLDWPFEGFWFDVAHNGVWWPTWGSKLANDEEQRERLKTVLAEAPKLIPLFGHRYIPDEPCESGNPVFSVYQTDVIYYGANLLDWLERESGTFNMNPWPQVKEIRFWSEAVERNNVPRL